MKISFDVDLSEAEDNLVKRLGKRSKFYIFLRSIRHRLLDDAMQNELEAMFSDKPRGKVAVPAAQLVLMALLQAYEKASDDDAIENAIANDRWKLVLGTLGSNESPCCKKTLVFFRQRMVEHGMSNQVLDKTIELARQTKLFDYKKVGKLRVAFDSAPLRGAGRVEDTINLVGHGIKNVLIALAALMGATWMELAHAAELPIVGQDRSVKAALDLDWNEPDATDLAITRLVQEAQQLRTWLDATVPELLDEVEIQGALRLLERLIEQDTESKPQGGYRIKTGVTPDRIISISDPDMRHGRKSSSQTIKGYKRYDVSDLDSHLTLGSCALPANVPEADGADKLGPRLHGYGPLAEIQIDRAFLSSPFVLNAYYEGTRVLSKPFPYPKGSHFDKSCFSIDLGTGTVRCPADQATAIVGSKASYSAKTCKPCPLREQCYSSKSKGGRTIQIHKHEGLMQQLHAAVKDPAQRKQLRERVKIEHSLAHICARQGPRARYRTVAKNDYDLARQAVVKNLFLIKRHIETSEIAA
jgi:hypothetical protein